MTESTALTALCARTLDNLKAENVIALDLRDVDSSPADYFVICTANSDTHARALTDALARVTLSVGERRPRTEGRDTGEWVLLDYFDVVVHVFRTTAREYYKLEKLWGDAPAVTLKQLEEQSKEEKAKEEKAKSKEEKPKAAKSKTAKAPVAKKATEKIPAPKATTTKATTKAPTKAPKEVVAEKPVKKTTGTAKKSVQAADATSAEAPKAKRNVAKTVDESKVSTAKAKSVTKASATKTESPKKVSVKKVSTKKASEE